MTGTATPSTDSNLVTPQSAGYSKDSDLVDFILGITFEIWEQGQVEFIHDYYAQNVQVYSLEGMTNSAPTMIENTYKTLDAYPDRLLIADDVITRGTTHEGFSSHRLHSPMTNKGATLFGPATGKQVLAMNIADCEVENGLITREWLVRDNLAVARQLGFDPLQCAGKVMQQFEEKQLEWLHAEFQRTKQQRPIERLESPEGEIADFARHTLEQCWQHGNQASLESAYAPYCVMHRAPLHLHSGSISILQHYGGWRTALPDATVNIDHVCHQPFDAGNQRIAVRWSVAGHHRGEIAGNRGIGKPIYILGVTHWQLVEGRIAAEWTVFDELAVLAQTLI